MKLSSLLTRRQALLESARLANLAFAYERLSEFVRRIEGAKLSGAVQLRPADPDAQRYSPVLVALEGSQSVIEEFFDDQDLFDLADILAFALVENTGSLTFRLEEVSTRFLLPLRDQLCQAGVIIDRADSFHEAPPGLAEFGHLDDDD